MADEAHNLTPEELADLVVVADARTTPEAAYLTDMLESAGIPVMTQAAGALAVYGVATTSIRVPRIFERRAQAVVTAARNTAQDKSIDDAFDENSVAERTADAMHDPVMAEMFMLREAPDAQRDERLRGHILEWLIGGLNSTDVARYLAAAGLTYEQARDLVEDVKIAKRDDIKARRGEAHQSASRYILLAVAGLVVAILMAAFSRNGAVILIYGPFLAGVLALYRLQRTPASLKKSDESDA
jgi:hypothetical protein